MSDLVDVSDTIRERASEGSPTQHTIVQNVAYKTGHTASTTIKVLNRLVENREVERTDSGRYTTR